MLFLHRAREALLTARTHFVLLDVGVSGGIDHAWRKWEPALAAFGFDPQETEIARLSAAEQNRRIAYVAGLVTCDDAELLLAEAKAAPSNYSFYFTGAWHLHTKRAADPAQGVPARLSSARIVLDRFCAERGLAGVDFIKTDTDGHDYYVLRGAETTLKTALGVSVECVLHGARHAHANIFTNIDRLLASHGFSLFGLRPWRYTRAALPGTFLYALPAQTTAGQVQWADALYLRDHRFNPDLFDPGDGGLRALKLLALYEQFDLLDCAADFIVMMQDRACLPAALGDGEPVLDALVPANFAGLSYREFLRSFDEDATRFYPK